MDQRLEKLEQFQKEMQDQLQQQMQEQLEKIQQKMMDKIMESQGSMMTKLTQLLTGRRIFRLDQALVLRIILPILLFLISMKQ
ncbi:hypothetical protein Gotur_031057 [Gossypium turneri]